MNKYQHSELTMLVALQTRFESFPAMNAYPALQAQFALLVIHNNRIKALSDTQRTPLRAKLNSRDQALAESISMALIIGNLLLGHANDHGLGELATLATICPSDFSRVRMTERPALARRILEAARSVVAEVTERGITPALLDEFEGMIDTASKAVVASRDTAIVKKTSTRELNTAFRGAQRVLETGVGPLVELLRTKEPEFYAAYRTARQALAPVGRRRPAPEAPPAPEATPAAAVTA